MVEANSEAGAPQSDAPETNNNAENNSGNPTEAPANNQ